MTNNELIQKAKEALEHAYAPYSGFQVGTALLAANGEVFSGCNVENASYGACICAERTAAVKAVSQGVTVFEKIAIVGSSKRFTYPCGICRQFLAEFMPDGKVVLEDKELGVKEINMRDLLPDAFTGKDMSHGE